MIDKVNVGMIMPEIADLITSDLEEILRSKESCSVQVNSLVQVSSSRMLTVVEFFQLSLFLEQLEVLSPEIRTVLFSEIIAQCSILQSMYQSAEDSKIRNAALKIIPKFYESLSSEEKSRFRAVVVSNIQNLAIDYSIRATLLSCLEKLGVLASEVEKIRNMAKLEGMVLPGIVDSLKELGIDEIKEEESD